MSDVFKLQRDTFQRFLGNDPRAIRAFETLFDQASSGITSVAQGGTGLDTAPEDGQILIGASGQYALGFLIGSDNIQVTNAAGSISVTVFAIDAELITSGTLDPGRLPAFSGDISTPQGESVATLATVNPDPGSYGAADTVPTLTINGKGLVTDSAQILISIVASQVSDLGTIATQDANAVDITGGTINNTPIGGTTPEAIKGTTLTATGAFGCNGKTAQAAATVGAAIGGSAGALYTATEQGLINALIAEVNQLRAAIVANGIAA